MTHNFYFDGPGGQIHVHGRVPDSCTATPLVCLHPMPNSGAFFGRFSNYMASDRAVYCPDLPGYGSSHRLIQPPTIGDFANSIAAVIDQLPDSAAGVDLLGFHTGCLVAAELSASGDDRVRRLVLPGIPYFDPERRAELVQNFQGPPDYLDTPVKLGELWQTRQAHVEAGASRDEVFQIFLEDLRSAPNGWWGFKAAFEYPAEERFPLVKQSTLAIADKGLHDPTVAAAGYFPNCELIPKADWGAPLFLLHAQPLADMVRAFLDR